MADEPGTGQAVARSRRSRRRPENPGRSRSRRTSTERLEGGCGPRPGPPMDRPTQRRQTPVLEPLGRRAPGELSEGRPVRCCRRPTRWPRRGNAVTDASLRRPVHHPSAAVANIPGRTRPGHHLRLVGPRCCTTTVEDTGLHDGGADPPTSGADEVGASRRRCHQSWTLGLALGTAAARETIRKMIIAMARDGRVLGDQGRRPAAQTCAPCASCPPEKRQARKAREDP